MIAPGDLLEEWDFLVEAGKVAEFGRAVQDAGAGSGGIAPPTFPVVASAPFVERLVSEIFGLDPSRTVHGEHGYEYFEPIRVGDRLHCRATMVSDDTKIGRRGGTMRILVSQVEFTSLDSGRLICRETMTTIEMGAERA